MVGSGDRCIPTHDVETVRGGAHGNVGGPPAENPANPHLRIEIWGTHLEED